MSEDACISINCTRMQYARKIFTRIGVNYQFQYDHLFHSTLPHPFPWVNKKKEYQVLYNILFHLTFTVYTVHGKTKCTHITVERSDGVCTVSQCRAGRVYTFINIYKDQKVPEKREAPSREQSKMTTKKTVNSILFTS